MDDFWIYLFWVLSIFTCIFLVYTATHCEGNMCCPCGLCESRGWYTDCNHCQCVGPGAEGCHMTGWNMSSPCCNESSTTKECSKYLGE